MATSTASSSSSSPPPIKILCIIPISTTGMTDDLSRIYPSQPGLEITFIDGRDLPGCPPCIENHAQAIASTTAVLPRALDHLAFDSQEAAVDAVLVCCFSDHPLVYALREACSDSSSRSGNSGSGSSSSSSSRNNIPITGIFQAALEEASSDGGRFGIVTTAQAWEDPLTESVTRLGFGDRSAGVAATGLGVLELESLDRRVVVDRIATHAARLVGEGGADSIILGCAGMTALEREIRGALPEGVRTVDGVRAGIGILSRAVRERRRRHQPQVLGGVKCE